MAALCRDLRKYSLLQEDTYQRTRLRSQVSACWVMALPKADRFDRTTSHASNFSSAGSISDIEEKLRLEIAARVPRSFYRGELESDGDRQMIYNWDQAAGPLCSRH